MPTSGMPGLRGTDHIGITVPDLDQAIDFFVRVIGCEAFYPLGPYRADDDWMKENLNVHARAEIRGMRLLRCGNGANLELFEYTSPDQRPEPPRNSDIGGHHICFYVDDMNAAVRYLRESGIRVLGEPKPMPPGPSEGMMWVYFLAPWGLQLELNSYPDGKAYERTTDRRLWDPRASPDKSWADDRGS